MPKTTLNNTAADPDTSATKTNDDKQSDFKELTAFHEQASGADANSDEQERGASETEPLDLSAIKETLETNTVIMLGELKKENSIFTARLSGPFIFFEARSKKDPETLIETSYIGKLKATLGDENKLLSSIKITEYGPQSKKELAADQRTTQLFDLDELKKKTAEYFTAMQGALEKQTKENRLGGSNQRSDYEPGSIIIAGGSLAPTPESDSLTRTDEDALPQETGLFEDLRTCDEFSRKQEGLAAEYVKIGTTEGAEAEDEDFDSVDGPRAFWRSKPGASPTETTQSAQKTNAKSKNSADTEKKSHDESREILDIMSSAIQKIQLGDNSSVTLSYTHNKKSDIGASAGVQAGDRINLGAKGSAKIEETHGFTIAKSSSNQELQKKMGPSDEKLPLEAEKDQTKSKPSAEETALPGDEKPASQLTEVKAEAQHINQESTVSAL